MRAARRLVHALALALCWPASPTCGGEARESVTLQLKWQHQFQFAGYYAAKEKGFYRAAGLDVRILEAVPGMDPVQEVLSGRAQFGVGTSELMLNRQRGDPVVVLGAIFQHSPLSLVTLAESGLDNIHKLAGRRLMIEPNSAELFAYLLREGFTANAFRLQFHGQSVEALLAGETDALSVYSTDETYVLKRHKRAYNLFSPRMGGIDFYGDNFFTLQSRIESSPKQVEAFRLATLQGWKYAMQHPEEIADLIYRQYSQRHDPEHLRYEAEEMRQLMRPDLVDPGYMNVGRWRHMAETYRQLGLLSANFDVEPMLYFSRPELDLQRLESRLYYAVGGLLALSCLSLAVFRLYRRAHATARRLNTLFDHAPVSMIVLDPDDRIKGWNAQAETTFVWRAEEAIGLNVLDLLVPVAHRAKVAQLLREVRAERRICRSENPNVRRDGGEIVCEWLNAPFRGTSDESDYILCMARDITEQKRLERELIHAAHYDSLTGLPNRTLILEFLRQALAMAKRQNQKLAVLFLDLDKFKTVNDTLGHEAGDRLLVGVAQRLPLPIREGDQVGRLAGDEFLVILHNVGSLHNAQKISDKLRESISRPYTLLGHTVRVGVSVGLALYPDHGQQIDALVNAADRSMYRSKRGQEVVRPVRPAERPPDERMQ